jgi:SOS response regulatory protein OraA/RecX
VDDERVAGERARRLDERGWSNAAIRLDLEQRGITHSAIDTILGELGDERDRAFRLVQKLGPGPKTARMLARRGYPTELADLAVGPTIAEEP